MKQNGTRNLFLCLLYVMTATGLQAQNPLITDQFTADPSARVFEGRLYVFPSHDVPCGPGQGFIGFCMPDYHVFSSENLTDWTDHGVILSQNQVNWVDSNRYSFWAPDCIEKDGKYYFYFPAVGKDTTHYPGMWVGVAVADKPWGPYSPEPVPMAGVRGIDPNPFIDRDGQAYLYWAGRGSLVVAKLSEDMKSIVGEPRTVTNLPAGFKEGPYLFERNGIYYFTYPTVTNKTEELAYATGDNPLGPFKYRGIIMDESPVGCWTNHHSILEYKGQWYLFYHHNDLSPDFDKNRSIRADSLFFEADGSIRKVIPSWRGVGLSPADSKIQIDRYSDISDTCVSIDYLDVSIKSLGWYIQSDKENNWIRYNQVDFGDKEYLKLMVRAWPRGSAGLEVHLDKPDGPLVSSLLLDPADNWQEYMQVAAAPKGVHDLFLVLKSNEMVKLDWIRFE
ncbi:MAG: family 43 glycosylhydrolase [Bacteroidales bacterium]|nr:family 43 glycosylhydrolase [Bacteroidales bacterium]